MFIPLLSNSLARLHTLPPSLLDLTLAVKESCAPRGSDPHLGNLAPTSHYCLRGPVVTCDRERIMIINPATAKAPVVSCSKDFCRGLKGSTDKPPCHIAAGRLSHIAGLTLNLNLLPVWVFPHSSLWCHSTFSSLAPLSPHLGIELLWSPFFKTIQAQPQQQALPKCCRWLSSTSL